MKAINVLLAVLISLFAFLSVFEIGLRVMGMGPIPTLNQFDAALGWSKTPDRTVHRKTEEYDVRFAINELGLRDDDDNGPRRRSGAAGTEPQRLGRSLDAVVGCRRLATPSVPRQAPFRIPPRVQAGA